MSASSLPLCLILSLLSGCAVAERVTLALAPDQQDRIAGRPVDTRPKPRTAKPLKPWPSALVASAEPILPPWSIPAPKPSRVLKDSLTPSELFKAAGPAVYTVAAMGQAKQQGTFQGSAVAVSSKEAITNCHVIAQAKTVTLACAAAVHRAEVIAADPSTDRCYLRVLDGELRPVPGFRDYATLAVGEVVFTIGSPKGLANTLGQGLVSGLRRSEDATQYIQITAPVSEGSSGGGLFDDRGNLIGVTTFTIKDSQNLNFAIAASQFWR